jgi:hypothetical protein
MPRKNSRKMAENINCTNLSSQKKAALGRIWLRLAALPELKYPTLRQSGYF